MGKILTAMVFFTVTAVIASPIVGSITDRVGPRRVVLTSIALFSLAMMFFSLPNGSFALYLAIGPCLLCAERGSCPSLGRGPSTTGFSVVVGWP